MKLRFSYPSWVEGHREIATAFNTHRHEPYSKTASGVGVNTTLDDGNHTVSVTTTGLTITLPPASAARVGQDWTVHLGVAGTVTITRQGSDTIYTPYSATDTSVQIVTLGDSVTFRCLSATTWGLV